MPQDSLTPTQLGIPDSTPPESALGHQFVAACLGDQDGGSGGVLLELLPQPINVRLERVSGDTGIVTPDLLQQRPLFWLISASMARLSQVRAFLAQFNRGELR